MTQEVHRQYDLEQAANYDRDREVEEHWHAENRFIQAHFAGRREARLLDVPVGTGRFLPYYDGIGEIVGVDASAEMLQMARARIEQLGLRAAVAVPGDVFALQFPDRHFDVAVCFRLMHLFDPAQVARALAEMARVTRGEIVLQAYVQGSATARAWSRLLRLPGKLLASLRDGGAKPRWSHIQAWFHSDATLAQCIADAGLKVARRQRLCGYQGHEVVVYLLVHA